MIWQVISDVVNSLSDLMRIWNILQFYPPHIWVWIVLSWYWIIALTWSQTVLCGSCYRGTGICLWHEARLFSVDRAIMVLDYRFDMKPDCSLWIVLSWYWNMSLTWSQTVLCGSCYHGTGICLWHEARLFSVDRAIMVLEYVFDMKPDCSLWIVLSWYWNMSLTWSQTVLCGSCYHGTGICLWHEARLFSVDRAIMVLEYVFDMKPDCSLWIVLSWYWVMSLTWSQTVLCGLCYHGIGISLWHEAKLCSLWIVLSWY